MGAGLSLTEATTRLLSVPAVTMLSIRLFTLASAPIKFDGASSSETAFLPFKKHEKQF
jgi:hypothetical protein